MKSDHTHSMGIPILVIIEVTVSLKTLVAMTTIVLLPTSRLLSRKLNGSVPASVCTRGGRILMSVWFPVEC